MPFASSSAYASSSTATNHTPHPIPNRPQHTMAEPPYSGYAQRARPSGSWNIAQTYAASAQNGHTERNAASPDGQSPASPASGVSAPQGMHHTLAGGGSSAPPLQRKGSSGGASDKEHDGEKARAGRDWDREKPRDRDERERDRSTAQEDEVISTIFVVGFPDDMQVRSPECQGYSIR
jgi:hypothetical protein